MQSDPLFSRVHKLKLETKVFRLRTESRRGSAYEGCRGHSGILKAPKPISTKR